MLTFNNFLSKPESEIKPTIVRRESPSYLTVGITADDQQCFAVNLDEDEMFWFTGDTYQKAAAIFIKNSRVESRETGKILQDVSDEVFMAVFNKIMDAWSYVAPGPEKTEITAPEQDVAEELKQDVLEEPKQDEPEPSKPVEEPKPAETVTDDYDPLKTFIEAAGISKWDVYMNRSDDNDFVVQADGIFYRVTKWKTGAGLHVIEVHPLSDNTKVLSIAHYSKLNAISNVPVEDRILIEIIDTFEGE